MDWKSSAELTGIAAIVGSLIFVGLQLKQSQEIAVAAQYQARFETAMEFWGDRIQTPVIARRIGEMFMDSDALPDGFNDAVTAEEFGIVFGDTVRILLIYDNKHFQFSSGFLTDGAWAADAAALRTMLNRPITEYVVNHFGFTLRAEFLHLCKTLIRENQQGHKE